jgi:CheY-like chemotaxis protein
MSPNRLSNLTIVVVEDHDDARRYLGIFLDQLGASVVLARNAFEGLEAIKNNHPNLVVSDINMPGMDGFELLREIRAFGSDAGGNVPVVAMTAHVTHADRARILNAGLRKRYIRLSALFHLRAETKSHRTSTIPPLWSFSFRLRKSPYAQEILGSKPQTNGARNPLLL